METPPLTVMQQALLRYYGNALKDLNMSQYVREVGGCGLDSADLGLVAGFCKNGNEPSESMSIKGREFFD
jgi:hypothetical protein